jgi:uncharacterized protein YndB with AHSA1/START domain
MSTGKTSVELSKDREVVITRTFSAPRRLVWEAMSRPEHVRRWYGLKVLALVVCEIDQRVGGRWRFVLRAPDGNEHAFSGVYREIVAPERVVYTESYEPLGPGHEIEVTTTLEENDGRTRLTARLVHKSPADRDAHIRSGMEVGANESHDRLAELLATLARPQGDRMPRSAFLTPPPSALSRKAALASLAATGAFVALLAALHVLRPDLQPSWRFISEYELGEHGWLMRAAFLALAIGTGSVAVAVASQARSFLGYAGIVQLALSAAGMILAAVFVPDARRRLHEVGAMLDQVPFAALCIAGSLSRNERWAGR